MPHITTHSSVPLSVISLISFPTTLTLDLHNCTTRRDLCNNSSGTMSTRGLLDLPSVRTRPLKFMRMWEIFSDDKDLTSSEIAYYWDVISEEILEGEMLSFDKEHDSSGDESDISKYMTSP